MIARIFLVILLVTNFNMSVTLAQCEVDITVTVPCPDSSIGVALATPGGGIGPYTFLWDTWPTQQTTASISGLSQGDYHLTMTDALGCVALDTAVLIAPDSMVFNLMVSGVRCTGESNGSVWLTVTGLNVPVLYEWSHGLTGTNANSATGLSAGVYTITATDADACQKIVTLGVSAPPPMLITPEATNASSVDSCDSSIEITMSGGSISYTCEWDNGLGTDTLGYVPPPGEYTSYRENLCVGTYCVLVTNNNGCSDSLCVTVDTLNTTNQPTLPPFDCVVAPNPFSEKFILSYKLAAPSEVSITVFNIRGETIQQFSGEKGEGTQRTEIPTLGWDKGIYFLYLKTDRQHRVKRLIKF